jgi:hypothetical protein
MVRKYLFIGLFTLVCAGLAGVILLKRTEKITPVELVQAVPGDAILFIEKADYAYLTEVFLPGSRIWVDFVNTSGKARLDSLFGSLRVRVEGNQPLHDYLSRKGISLSVHLLGKERLAPLLYIHYAGSFSDHEFEQMVRSLLEEGSMVNERRYESEELIEVSASPGSIPGRFTFACVNGICLVSPSSLLVEESIRTIHASPGTVVDPGLQLVRETAGRHVHANLYINYPKLHQLFYPLIRQESWDRLQDFSLLASWGELDLDIKEDAIVLNGLTYADPQVPLFLGAFASQTPVKMELIDMMPSGTSWFLHLGISDLKDFVGRIETYLNGKGEWAGIRAARENAQREYGVDPLGELAGIAGDEMAWIFIEGGSGKSGEELFVVETRSRSESSEVVIRWVEQYLQVHSLEMQSYRQVYRLDSQTSFDIYRMPEAYSGILQPLGMFHPYFTVFEKWLIFGPSAEALSRVIYQNVLHKTIISDPVFLEMSDHLSSRANLSLFFRPFALLDQRRELLSDHAEGELKAMEVFLNRIPGVVIQYSSGDRLLYQGISVKYASQIRQKALTVWESLLDTVALIKPALVINHNTQEKEIFVQDASNKIYLINSAGRILWEQKLESRIQSNIHQVDYFRNGKLQYLFNTSGKLHLIDRNGNYVERYPVSLRSAATAPLALFDYDNSRDYRIFVAGEDRGIHVYDLEGNVVTGWKFGKTESIVTNAPQHFRIGDTDYITLTDRNRPYFLDRQGRERFSPKHWVVFSPGNPLSLDMNIREEHPRWISTDTAGNVVCIYLDGSVSTLLGLGLDSDHSFSMQDLDKDGIPDYVFTQRNELRAVRQDGRILFSFKVSERIGERPDFYNFSTSDIKIGITDRSSNRIYLVNADGSLYGGFPLEGSTRFSIGYFTGSGSRFNLIVGSQNSFLYNYSIE